MTARARTALLTILALIAFVTTASAQVRYRIIEVQIEGNQTASRSLIMGVSSLKVGSDLTPTAVSETIRRLYGLGFFKDIQVEAEEVPGGVKIFVVVKELPKLGSLTYSGNKQIKTKDLEEALRLGVGGYISPYLIQEKKTHIEDLYAEKGYFRVEATPVLTYNFDSTIADLEFKIDEKSKVKVEKVVMYGNSQVDAGDVIGKMRNRKRGLLKSSNFAQDKYDEDLGKVIDEFHKRGFIDAHLISDSMYIDTLRNRMTIYLNVYEGPRYYFGNVEITGCECLPADYLESLIKFDSGDVFNSEKYDESLNEIHSAYWDVGHLHSRVDDVRTTRQDSVIDVSYDISEGLPSHVKMISIIGNNRTKDRVIRREISMLPGNVFRQDLLIRSVRDVMALNYFESAVPTPLALPNGDVDIEFEVTEKRTGEVMAGAGYNSQDKLVGNVGIGIPNFRGMGQNVAFNVEFGSNRNSFSASFSEPWLFGYPTSMALSLYTINRNWYDEYIEGSQGGSIRIGRRLRWPDNYFRIYASYGLERTRYYDFDDDYESECYYKSYYYYNDPSTDDTVLDEALAQHLYNPYPGSIVSYNEEWLTGSTLSLTLTRDSRNLPQFATSGSKMSYTIEQTGGFLGGFWHYMKHNFEISKFIPLFWKFSLGAKLNYAVVTSPSGDDRIQVSDRFTPGGTDYDGTVRGYDGGSLTPDTLVAASDTTFLYDDPDMIPGVDPPDDTLYTSFTTRVRGKYMLVTNIELQFPIVERQVYGMLFFDAGNSWLHKENIKPFHDLYRGVGLGFRIVVPGIGTIGFDFGYALDDHDGDGRGWKPHFQIGSTFR
ncbi:MAG TPA: outer membrane protein assembly factor BamA [candidate division Zixibacteria bacterium]|nr:outer membrane protein assembly factor BamA [candidate division Zixibacteria bacterium]